MASCLTYYEGCSFSILEVENGYIITNSHGDKWVYTNLTAALKAIRVCLEEKEND
jgi:hypothetical protein